MGREVHRGLLGSLARFFPAAPAEFRKLGLHPTDADITREQMRFPQGEVQHRFRGKLQADEVFGSAIVFVGLDAAEEADALGGVDECVAVGDFTEVKGTPHGGADGGASSR